MVNLQEWEIATLTLKQAEEWFLNWATRGQISRAGCDEILDDLRMRRDRARSVQDGEIPAISGILPIQNVESPVVQALRLWLFLVEEIMTQKEANRLSLAQAHSLAEECMERVKAIKRKMDRDGMVISMRNGKPEPVPGTPVPKTHPLTPRRGIFEILLDPHSIQWLMGLGGVLMAVGLVILLWINDFFTPKVIAAVMGASNIGVLIGGYLILVKTRYQLVGKGLMLLACLVMPLNLWYYDAQAIMTIDGHLWVVAVVISALYGASARVLQDAMFVYVFNAGVAMTGLLILADLPPSPERFWEIAGPASLLVGLGLVAIHAERAFADHNGPFGRQRFGLASFRSGHVLLGLGLLLVFVAQLAGDWLYAAWFRPFYEARNLTPSPICGEQRGLGLLLVLLGTYAYTYSDLVVRRTGRYFHCAAFTLLWAEVLFVELLHLDLDLDAIIAVLAITSLVVNLAQATILRQANLTRAVPVFGLLLGLLPVLLGCYEYFRFLGFREVWVGQTPQGSYVGAMLLAAVASRVGAHVYRDATGWLPVAYYFASAAATLVMAVAALAALGLERWQEHAPIMMLIPIAYLVAAKLYGERAPAVPLTWVAHTATVVMLISSLASAFAGFTQIVEGQNLNLSLALFFAEAALFYGLAAAYQRKPHYIHWVTVMASGAFWQLMTFFGFPAEAYLLTYAAIGLALLLVYRFSVLEQMAQAPLAEAAFKSANTLISLAFVASAFRGLSRIANHVFGTTQPLEWSFAGFSLTMLAVSVLAVTIVKVAAWRRWYLVNVVAQGALLLLAVHQLIRLSFWQQIELFSVVMGLVLLGIGHLGWYREQDRDSDLVSMNLYFGSLLAVVPLVFATWIDRGHGRFLIADEAGFLFLSLLLLGTGVVFQLKATTLVGASSTALYFVTLLILVPWDRLSTVAILITAGGGTLFGLGLILAFFRDRLLTLPEQIHKREGLFRVLNWR